MYLAYVRTDVEVGTTVDGISFTAKKSQYAGSVIFLKPSKRGSSWYIKEDSVILLHESWLECITEVDSDIKISYTGYAVIVKRFKEPVTNETMYKCIKNGYCVHGNIYEPSDLISSGTTYISGPSGYEQTCSCCGAVKCTQAFQQRDVCVDCYQKYKKICELCGEYYFSKDENIYKTDAGNKRMCSHCLENTKTCEQCGVICFSGGTLVEGDTYCSSCSAQLGKGIKKCYVCKTSFKEDSKHILKVGEKYICGACDFHKRTHHLKGGIEEYNFKPSPSFFNGPNKRNNLFFGVELEVVTPYTRSDKYSCKFAKFLQYTVNKESDFCYCKYDRSIGNDGMNGFEIVTHPFSWDYLISDDGRETIDNLLSVKKYGCTAFHTNSCGMHVHISKKAFLGYDHLYNFLSLVYNNKDFSILVSERTDMKQMERYCHFKVSSSNLRDMAEEQNNLTPDRHLAINLNNRGTVELRIFRSTVRHSRFMKNMEFTKSLFEFSKKDNDLSNYKTYIHKNRTEYQFLYDFLTKKGAI